jgi:hypothetical protein
LLNPRLNRLEGSSPSLSAKYYLLPFKDRAMAKAKKKKEDLDEIVISKEDIMELFNELERQGIKIDYEKKPKKKKKK